MNLVNEYQEELDGLWDTPALIAVEEKKNQQKSEE